MNNEIYGARDVTKTNTLSVETFKSCNFGRLGFISGTTIEFCGQSSFPHTVNSVFSLAEIKDSSVPRVDIVYSHTGEDASPLNAKAEKNPTSPASRGAEAIPAQRERRSRRAYHPRSGKMRADCPLRRTADREHDMR